jgi:U3 small nucleolar RNA-associated protein 13
MMAGVKFVQVVGDDDDDEAFEQDEDMRNADDDDVQPQDEEEAAGTAENRPSGLLSKSWSIASAHVPTFTGGKVTHSYHVETPPVEEQEDGNDDDEDDDGNQKTQIVPPKPFLLMPVHGDVAIVDAQRGVKWGTLRTGADETNGSAFAAGGDEDEDDDDGVDHDDITSYALDNRNHTIVTCSRNNLLRQYAIHYQKDGRCTTQLVHTWGRSGHTLPLTQMAFHSSNVFLATGSVDGTVRIWDVRGRYVTHVFRPLEGGDGGGSGRLSVTGLAWKPVLDQLIVSIARDDGSIAIHDLRDKDNLDRVVVLRDHVSAVTCMEWWGQDIFVSTGRDAILNLWRVVESNETHHQHDKDKKSRKKKKDPRTLIQHQPIITYRRIQTIPVYEQVQGMVLPPSKEDELQIVTAGSKGVLRYWTAHVTPGKTPHLKQDSEQPSSQVFGEARGGYMGLALNHPAVAEESDEELMIAIDAEHNLTFVNSKLALNRTIVGHNDEILDMKIVPNSDSVVVATNSPLVRVFDLNNFSCSVLDGHSATVLCVDASPCGRYLASCGKDKTLRLWDSTTNKCIGVATGHTEPIGACGLSQKIGKYEVGGKAARNGGGAFCITASIDRTLKRWNLLGPEEWDGENGEPIELVAALSIRGHEKDINIISIAPNDSIVASGSQDKTVKLWNATDLTLKATLKGHRRGVWDCQFSPIDRVVATASGDKTIKLWTLSDYSCVRTFQGHLSSVLRVRFLSTGLQLVSSGADGLIKLWTIRTNECEATLDGHSDKVWAMDLSYGGSKSRTKDLLVSGGADSRIVVWDDTTAQLEAEERKERAENVLLDQQMANHLRHKEFDKALEIALKMEKPMQTMKVLTALLENETSLRQPGAKKGSAGKATVLRKHVASWDLDRVAQILKYCREWNTRARNAPLAMWVVQAIVTTVPVDKLASKAATRTEHGSIPEILAGITPYAERHFDRLDRLYTSSYLLDFLLFNMSSFDPRGDKLDEAEFSQWEAKSKMVLPPKYVDGRIQIGGKALVGVSERAVTDRSLEDSDTSEGGDDEVITVGDSSTSSEENDSDADSVSTN